MIRIMTDTASDISLEFASKNNITLIPMHVTIDGKEYLDKYEITGEKFFELLPNLKETPKTSQIPPFEFEKYFNEYSDDEIICITMSSKLSGTFQSANLAAQDFDNVSVVDSMSVTCGEKILVLYALELIAKGLTRTEIVKELNEKAKKSIVIGLLDTLEYLKRGGRISAVKAALGTILHIKPIIEITNGVVEMGGKARGVCQGRKMVKDMSINLGIDTNLPIGFAYSGLTTEIINSYINESKEIYPIGYENDYCLIGSTIGTHIGPNAIAVAFFIK